MIFKTGHILEIISLVLVVTAGSASPLSKAAAQAALRLMPVPAQVETRDGKLVIDSGFRVAMTGYSESRLTASLQRFLLRLERRTGIPLPTGLAPDPREARLVVHCDAAGEDVQSMKADESYTLEVTPTQASLNAPTPLGIMHGLETILQLVDLDSDSFYLPAVRIQDRPRFPWRGLLIDVARHWQPIGVLKRNLDGMAAVKLNVLHWHLSDDQGFRVESKVFPKLQTLGSDGNFFTQDQIREVVAYARDRGIRVMPEFDMPGHTTSFFVGYPELASAPGPYQIERQWGIFDPCLDPGKEVVYTFLDSFVGEMAALFPDEYFHIGGDEVNGNQWNASASIKAFKEKNGLRDNEAFHAYFNKRLVSILAKHGKKMIGWDEILSPDLPRNIMVQSWRGQKSLADGARKGYQGILSYGYYLDHMLTASSYYQVDPLDKEAAGLTTGEKALILGGEACMWSEFVTPENIDSRIWPRMAAIAERLWSPQSVKDNDDMYRRLDLVSRELESLGLSHRSSYKPMLQRLAGDYPYEPLKALADLVEPVKYYERGQTRPYTSLQPYNRFVDAVRPESDAGRQFNQIVDQAVAEKFQNKETVAQLRTQLTHWRMLQARTKQAMDHSFLLQEVAPVAEKVNALCAAGLQALDYIQSGQKPPEAWRAAQKELLARAEKAQAEVLIMIAPGVKKLISN